MTIAVLPAMIRPLLETRLPTWLDPHWFSTKDDVFALAPKTRIGWFDMYDKDDMAATMTAASNLGWLNSLYAGVEHVPLNLLAERGVTFTNGAGINAITIAEYAVMGILTIAKGYDQVVRARDRHEWLTESPGKVELLGSKALLLGAGAIGGLIRTRLEAFGVEVLTVRRTPGPDEIGPDAWRDRLGEIDWIVIAVPVTPDTDGMIGRTELAAMKPTAVIVNIARGQVIDQDALVEALSTKRIAAAFLDVTTPEPLPADHPLWALPNAHITMHLSGRSQNKMFERAADRFLDNLDRWHRGDPLHYVVDFQRGY